MKRTAHEIMAGEVYARSVSIVAPKAYSICVCIGANSATMC